MEASAIEHKRAFTDRVVIVTFALVVLCLTGMTWARYFHDRDGRVFPLFLHADRFNDLLNYSVKMLHLDLGAKFVGSGFPVFNYLAPAAFLYHFLLSAPNPIVLFLTLVVGPFALLLAGAAFLLMRAKLFRWESALGLFALAVSFPMVFVLYRANLEGVVWALTTVALCLFLRRRYTGSALFLAFAMSIKPFPSILLLLFVARRQFRAAALCVGVGAVTILGSLAAIGPGVLQGYEGLRPGVLLYTHEYIQTFRSPIEQEYTHGILDVLKVMYEKTFWFRFHTPPYSFDGQLTPTIFPAIDAVIALGIGAVMVWRLRRMPILNQVFGATLALALFPPSAADYTLCSLYLPTLLLGYFLSTEVRSGRFQWTARHMLLLLLPLAALMSPLTLLGLWTSAARLLFLLLLAYGVISLPLTTPWLEEKQEGTPYSPFASRRSDAVSSFSQPPTPVIAK